MATPSQIEAHKAAYKACKGCEVLHATFDSDGEPLYTECLLHYKYGVCPIHDDDNFDFIRRMRFTLHGKGDEVKTRKRRTRQMK